MMKIRHVVIGLCLVGVLIVHDKLYDEVSDYIYEYEVVEGVVTDKGKFWDGKQNASYKVVLDLNGDEITLHGISDYTRCSVGDRVSVEMKRVISNNDVIETSYRLGS